MNMWDWKVYSGNKILWIINQTEGDDESHDSGKYNNHHQNLQLPIDGHKWSWYPIKMNHDVQGKANNC